MAGRAPALLRWVAIYLRVSTLSQKLDSQKGDLEAWARGQKEAVRWYEDHFSGKTMQRPGWKKLQQDLAEGRVLKVVVWRIDRLGRSVLDLLTLFEDLQQRGVPLVSLREGIDWSTPAGRLVGNVLASLAQWETELRAERVAEGIAAAKRAGKKWGGSKKGWRWKVTPEQEEQVLQLKRQGQGVSYIARVTGLSRQTVYSLLREEEGEGQQ